MDRWPVLEFRLGGYCNPPRPGTGSSCASTASQATTFSGISEELERNRYESRVQRGSDIMSPSPSFDSVRHGVVEGRLLQKHERSHEFIPIKTEDEVLKRRKLNNGTLVSNEVEIIRIDDSDDDDDDNKTCIIKQLSSSQAQPDRNPQMHQKQLENFANLTEQSLEKSEARATKYHTKFCKLRHFYDKLKVACRRKDDEIRTLKEKTIQQSSKMMHLKAQIEKKDVQLQMSLCKIQALEDELLSQRTTISSEANNDVLQRNSKLIGEIAILKSTLQQSVANHLKTAHAVRNLYGSTCESYQQILGAHPATRTPVVSSTLETTDNAASTNS